MPAPFAQKTSTNRSMPMASMLNHWMTLHGVVAAASLNNYAAPRSKEEEQPQNGRETQLELLPHGSKQTRRIVHVKNLRVF